VAVKAGSQTLVLDEAFVSARSGLKAYEGRTVVLGIRPEDLEDAALAGGGSSGRCLRGKVELREALGSEVMVHFSVDAKQAYTEDVRELAEDVGAPGEGPLTGAEGSESLLVGRFGARSRVREGDSTEVAVDTRSLHFFDPETGLGIYEAKGAA
jgi:multiple sugar transport system ATP-binding protein